MQLTDLDFLTSPRGEALLARLAGSDLSESNTLKLISELRKDHSPDEARAAMSLARARVKAVAKFGADASRMFFTDDALQQASDPLVRRYRAALTGDASGDASMVDAGCGIGADSLTVAANGNDTLGIDIDPLRIEMARLNAAALNLPNARFEVADIRDGISADYEIAFFDPARRDAHGRRIHDVNRYIPPLSLIDSWRNQHIAVKLSPGVDLSQLDAYGGGVEFVSVAGDLKEAVLWRGFGRDGLRATLLDGESVHTYTRDGNEPEVPLCEPGGYLLEPDAAILRAGLVRDLAAELDAAMLDETIAYLTADAVPDSVWVRSWRILDWMPFHLKKLRAYLRERDVGNLTVKKRGFPMTPEEVIAKLKPKGRESRVLVMTKLRGNPVVLVCGEPHP